MDVYLYRKYDVSISDMSMHLLSSLDASVGVLRCCKSLVLATPICTSAEASSTLHEASIIKLSHYLLTNMLRILISHQKPQYLFYSVKRRTLITIAKEEPKSRETF